MFREIKAGDISEAPEDDLFQVVTKVFETQEEFIFQTIQPFCERQAHMVITKDKLIRALTLLREQETNGGWISVKERMPEPNDSVLLAVYDRDHRYTYRTVAWLNTSGDWDSNDDGFNQGDEDVLYWMPLPEPPEEVSGDAD